MSLIELVVTKAFSRITGTEAYTPRGVLSEYAPAVGRLPQPQRTTADAYSTITPQRRREIILKSPTAAAMMNTIINYSTGVTITVRNADPSIPPPARATKLVKSLLASPNQQDDSLEFRKRLIRDLLIFGYAIVEVEPGVDGSPAANLYVLDGANFGIDFDEHGEILGYYQRDVGGNYIIGRDGVHTFTPNELIYYQLDPRSESGYPTSRVDQLFACAVIEQLMLAFIGGRFTDSNIPFGVMDLGDLTKDEVEEAVDYWNQQVEENDHPEHKIIFTGSKGGANWLKFGYNMQELEAPQLLSAVRMYMLSIFGVTSNEMGEGDNVNKANGFNLSYTFKKRAIEPVLDTFVFKTTQRLIHQILGFTDLEIFYEEIDSRDELLESQIDDAFVKLGIYSINYVRNKKGQPSIEGGDEPYVFLGASIIPVSMLGAFAQAQLDALEILNIQSQVGIQQVLQQMTAPQVDPTTGETKPAPPLPPLGTLPLMRMMQPPERFTTPDASGSSSFKFGMPKPSMKPQPSSAAPPTKPKGKVEAAQRMGARKDNMNA